MNFGTYFIPAYSALQYFGFKSKVIYLEVSMDSSDFEYNIQDSKNHV